jgi:hypothetical protein
MAGLGPAIHVFAAARKGVHARIKPGYDGVNYDAALRACSLRTSPGSA